MVPDAILFPTQCVQVVELQTSHLGKTVKQSGQVADNESISVFGGQLQAVPEAILFPIQPVH